MKEGQATVVQRLDYAPPAFWIDSVDLTFDLDPAKTRVLNKMRVRRNPEMPSQALRLDGQALDLARVQVNGTGTSFKIEGEHLVLENLPEGEAPFDLEIFTTCQPIKNTQLSGLYVSGETFFTQCEAQGFRRITYFLDRPDVMASYSVLLRADKVQYPVLLSNGNLVQSGPLEDGRHFARWVDPHKKPCYLFALVAGQLVAREQQIISRAGHPHVLQVWVRPGDLGKTEHAMNSLVASIAWDEARFGLTLDLERFMIVATSDFNMGAMENKGLNIFNTKYVLASEATATDADFSNIESVVGHEYFHNWTGNRVTCRDWFQLSLKEGLTVFRDQEFSQDMAASPSARAVKRIEDVRVLRSAQFAEDAGPMAHPVRPDSYVEINNFYTLTVYEKGAEVVRMQQHLVGREGFARGMALYFERHDGQAVTCDDFVAAIADSNPLSPLAQHQSQFKRWYAQAGTPRVQVQGDYNAQAQTYTLTFAQSCPPTPAQAEKLPFVIPITIGLLAAEGTALALQVANGNEAGELPSCVEYTAVLTQATQQVTFINVTSPPVPSLLRGFSAPVVLDYPYSDGELLTLLAHDSDAFNRWEAGQRLLVRCALQNIVCSSDDGSNDASDGISRSNNSGANLLAPDLISALRQVLRHPQLDAAFKELVLTLPSEGYLAEQLNTSTSVNPQRIHAVREALRLELAQALHPDWQWAYETYHTHGTAYRPDAFSSGRRALVGLALSMLCLAAQHSAEPLWPGKTYQHFKDAGNMTDRFNALSALVQSGHALATPALERFYVLFKTDALVIDKWFALQAGCCDREGDVLPIVRRLLQHPDFSLKNPNRARSLIFSYCAANPAAFHRQDAAGYSFWAEQVLALDAINAQVAARLARAMDRWSRLAQPYRSAAHEAIARVAATAELSNDVREVVTRALACDVSVDESVEAVELIEPVDNLANATKEPSPCPNASA